MSNGNDFGGITVFTGITVSRNEVTTMEELLAMERTCYSASFIDANNGEFGTSGSIRFVQDETGTTYITGNVS